MRKMKLFGKKEVDDIVQDIEYVELDTAEIKDEFDEDDESSEESEEVAIDEEFDLESSEEQDEWLDIPDADEDDLEEELNEEEQDGFDEVSEDEEQLVDSSEEESEECDSTELTEQNFEIVDLDSDEDSTEVEEDKKVGWKKVLIIIGIVLGTLAGIYLAICLFFSQFFYYGTVIDGEDCSWKRVVNVEDAQENWVDSYELVLHTVDGKTESIIGDSIDMEYVEGAEVESILKSQNPFLWPQMFFNTYEYTTTIKVAYDKEDLNTVVDKLDCMNETQWTAPVNATVEYKDGVYEIVPHEVGTTIDETNFIKALDKALLTHLPEMDMLTEGCYKLPEHTEESQLVKDTITELNRLLQGTIQYSEGELVDANIIATWISVNELYEITLQDESIGTFVQTMADTYNTYGTTRSFTAPSGKAVEVTGYSYGWKVDQGAEVSAIKENIQGGEPVERELNYSSRGAVHAANDWGNTYAEVDLSAQKMWFIKDGNVVLESPIVTGQSGKSPTPPGLYKLSYKTSPAVLRAPLRPDGTREYETPVSYWMPFNGGIGFHDATWQSSFGGNAYTYRGSHGCVNMPLSKAKALYSLIYAGCPVVCHY